MFKSPALIALDFHPCAINFVLRDGLKSEPARFVVSFRVTRVPSFGPDLEGREIKSNVYDYSRIYRFF